MTGTSDNSIVVDPNTVGTLKAALVISGVLRYTWRLFDYSPDATGGRWTKAFVGKGRDQEVIEIGPASALQGHALGFLVIAVDFDPQARLAPTEAPVRVVLLDDAGGIYNVRKPGNWTVHPGQPTATVFVQVVAS